MVFGKKKQKIKVVLVRLLGKENYQKIGEDKANLEDNIISWKDKTFPITDKCYLYFNKNRPHIFIDYENEKILAFHNKDIGINAKMLDKLISTDKRGIIGQLLYSLKLDMQQKTNWVSAMKPLTIFVLGAVIGYLLGSPNPFGVS